MALRDPKPGDGSFTTGSVQPGSDAAQSTDPVPGGLSPTRSPEEREAIAAADTARDLLDSCGDVDAVSYPSVHRLAAGLADDRWDGEFETALAAMLDRIEISVAQPGMHPDSGD